MELTNALYLELLGPSVDSDLADYRESHDKLCPETVLRMSRQLLKALEFIHTAGMWHGGKKALPSNCSSASWGKCFLHSIRYRRSKHGI